MKKNSTELVFILDKSGSMHGLEKDTVGGFNSVIDEQKKPGGEVLVSTVLFSNDSETLHDRISIDRIAPLTEEDYVTGGCTALLDAVGDTIEHIGKIHKYIREEDVPEKTMFVITTDGMENASKKYRAHEIKRMIERKQEEGWNFIFMASNIDASEEAEKIGIDRRRAKKFEAGAVGSGEMFECINREISCFRSDSGKDK